LWFVRTGESQRRSIPAGPVLIAARVERTGGRAGEPLGTDEQDGRLHRERLVVNCDRHRKRVDVDPELLSDEERVVRLLRRNGRRMKQASIVAETGWSNAKVSQLLSKMDESDEIAKLRIGRENLITLPEVDPTEID
jgi:uncharacterized membrane protein